MGTKGIKWINSSKAHNKHEILETDSTQKRQNDWTYIIMHGSLIKDIEGSTEGRNSSDGSRLEYTKKVKQTRPNKELHGD